MICLDNQGIIQSVEHIRARPGQWILGAINDVANRISDPTRQRHMSLRITWISGHDDIVGNEEADKEAKLATLDGDNAPHLLPPILPNDTIPQSIWAAHQAFKLEMSKVWEKRWAQSPHFACMENIDPSLPSRQYRTLTDILTRAQSSVITQLQMGHIPLHKHLYRIKKVTSPLCPTCSRGDESVHHFLFECHTHEHARISLREVMGRNAKSLRHLLNTDKGIQAILHYMARTERLQPIYGDVTPAPSD